MKAERRPAAVDWCRFAPELQACPPSSRRKARCASVSERFEESADASYSGEAEVKSRGYYDPPRRSAYVAHGTYYGVGDGVGEQPPPQAMELGRSFYCADGAAGAGNTALARHLRFVNLPSIGAVSPSGPSCRGAGRACFAGSPAVYLSRGRESGPESRRETLELSCLFQLWPVLRRESRPATERREESSGRWPWIFRFRRMHSIFYPTLYFFIQRIRAFQSNAVSRASSSVFH